MEAGVDGLAGGLGDLFLFGACVSFLNISSSLSSVSILNLVVDVAERFLFFAGAFAVSIFLDL